MIPLQELTFHLASGETFFAHIVSIGNAKYAAQVSCSYPPGEIAPEKYYRWLHGLEDCDARKAFEEIAKTIEKYAEISPNNRIISVDNPCNCEFVSAEIEREIVGKSVKVLVNGKL